MMEIVPVEEIKAEALQVKYPIIDWEIHTEGSRKYWKIIRVRNITEAYQVFEDMLKGFDREDLVTLWSLVKERFRLAEPTKDKERALWVKLERLFEPDKDDVMWKLQRYMYDPLTWRLYGTCEVHHVSSTRGHDIYMLIENDYPLSTTVMNLMLSRRLQVEEDNNQRSVQKGSTLIAFSDLDHTGCLDSRKSTSGGIQFLGGDKLVSWLSKKQDCTSMSSAEAEYVSLSACCAQVEKGIVELFFIGTEYQIADLFTKALSKDRFKYLVRRLGMRCLTPEELEILANESS
ncbi:hypothetical protein Tco_1103038 [Tanacetum coccineum]